MNLQHSFNITETINPITGAPFGSKYAGDFVIHRPSIADNGKIALNYAALTAGHKDLNPAMLTSHAVNLLYIFCNMKVIASERPEWFDEHNLFDENDEAAVITVHQEVERWLDTFRPQRDSGKSKQGSGESAVLVQGEIQPSTT